MSDIFDNEILCRKCHLKMDKRVMNRNGFDLRYVQCEKCGEKIMHPGDMQEYKHFSDLKQKQFQVKLRLVGNSYAVSIPKEIVDFIKEQDDMVNDMVNLCFEEMNRISLMFNDSPLHRASQLHSTSPFHRASETQRTGPFHSPLRRASELDRTGVLPDIEDGASESDINEKELEEE
ncbi:AbrB/MazE/SpoVT family DNA-binding domain-containing protein [Candidatus Pacearchaeota archaeon]|nr:AbrB/MazE/SpoVT family DNA-binding domain-containing protein [Candidatus Pacearchaeota archaeon]